MTACSNELQMASFTTCSSPVCRLNRVKLVLRLLKSGDLRLDLAQLGFYEDDRYELLYLDEAI